MKSLFKVRWLLVLYDFVILFITDMLILEFYDPVPWNRFFMHTAVAAVLILNCRIFSNAYGQIWRYGGIRSYLLLFLADICAFILIIFTEYVILPQNLPFAKLLAISATNLLGCIGIRFVYCHAYRNGASRTKWGRVLNNLLSVFAGNRIGAERSREEQQIKIAIIGVGRVGAFLAEELVNDPDAAYIPVCFVDNNPKKIGRNVHNLPILQESDSIAAQLTKLGVKAVVFAIPNLSDTDRTRLYNYYRSAGFKVKIYDDPIKQTNGNKRIMREFDIEDLLFRKPNLIVDENTINYYRGKVILITGGGGSIGSEICRRLSEMQPRQIILVDIYENGAYDVQQEMRILHKGLIDIRIEITSVCNKEGLKRVFEEYHPQIIIHAAAHKHVPLMEKNCVEAIANNVFGTYNTVKLAEEYEAERFIMVSTDKAVNPTNIMGATKRLCEMIVLSHSNSNSKTKFSATRFGNVLGSAGSVIPLFEKQIANGGPVTLTDMRIIRYFMTIPEASQLVLKSGAMAKNGELFVLDMGQPVKILELAENMIRLAGYVPYQDIDIIETGLRPGEKLYEELLVKTEELDKTDDDLIFIERDTVLSHEELDKKLAVLREAVESNDDAFARAAIKATVPTYHELSDVKG